MNWQGGLVDIALAEHPSLRANRLMETVQDFPQTNRAETQWAACS